MTRRRGTSLVELIVTLAVLSALVTPMARLLVAVLRAERDAVRSVAAGTSAARLARMLRADVHASEGAEIRAAEGAPPELVLTLPDSRLVRYSPGVDRIHRTVEERTGEEASIVGRESFVVPEGETRLVVDGDPPLVTLTHRRRVEPGSGALVGLPVLRVEAAVGRDLRFAGE